METTGYKIAEERFIKPPALPYVVFTESVDVRGADDKNNVAERNISVELYANKIDVVAEHSIENLLNTKGIHYSKDRYWIDSESFFQTVYDFNLIEK